MGNLVRDKVFISYSRSDKEWLDKIQKMLKPLVRANTILLWNDTKIEAGQKWEQEIERALETAKVALLLVSPDFLDSDFIAEREVPRILEANQTEGVRVLCVALSHCLYENTKIADYQWANDPNTPLDGLTPADQNRVLKNVCQEITKAVAAPVASLLPDSDDELGPAVSKLTQAAASPFGTQGFVRNYLRGSLYFIANSGVPTVAWPKIKENTFFRVNDCLIGKRYESLGGTGSRLGFPLSNSSRAWDNNLRESCTFVGHIQFFEGGTIYQLERFGAHAIYEGEIRRKFRQSEIEMKESGREMTGGILGFPISEQEEVSSCTGTTGLAQRFIYGCVISRKADAYVVAQGFYDLYQSVGEWKGPLGLPRGDDAEFVSAVSGKKGTIQRFENGCTQWNDSGFYIHGPIYEKWRQDQRRLGFALNSETRTKDFRVQNFEGGRIERRADGVHTILG